MRTVTCVAHRSDIQPSMPHRMRTGSSVPV